MNTLLRCLCLTVLGVTSFIAPSPALYAQQVGGGLLNGGLDGEYFANPDLAGAPAFTRRDVRIDLDWGTLGKPGGSSAPGFADLGADSFSVRWQGHFSPRFSENYTFKLVADDGARLWLKRANESNFTLLIDAWASAGTNLASFALSAGELYDLRVEYRELSGPALVRLAWASPSVPEEVLEATTIAAINIDTYSSELWANAMYGGRDEWRDTTFGDNRALWPARDTNGWPLGDAETIVWEGRSAPAMAGTYLLQFKGRARLTTGFGMGRFNVGGTNYGTTLTNYIGWDPVSNLTTVKMTITNSDIFYLEFSQTRLTASSPTNTGVAEVKLMRPVAVGSTNAYQPTAFFTEPLKRAFARYTAIRWIMNFEKERTWAQRVRPAYSTHNSTGSKRHWEYMILLANETGKDLYACLPHGADDDYVTRVAKMLRYGSDGENPYDGPVENPLYPPLNPNLRAYIERGNEIWNWAFSQAPESLADGQREVRNNTTNGQILNYDGANPNGDNFNRWHALRTVQMSDLFRGVWGEAAMGERIRFLLEYQYDNAQNTASEAFDFLDRYFNNAEGRTNVAVARPLSYWIWGGGGALYYGSGNSSGTQTNIVFDNASFETPVLADGQVQVNPPGTSWNFTGLAGFYHRAGRSDLVTNQVLGTAGNAITNSRSVGLKFTTGPAPLGLYELGRWKISGNSRTHTLRLIRASDQVQIASVDVDLNNKPAGQYVWASVNPPVALGTNTTYYLVSSETVGGDTFCDATTTIAPCAGITVDGAVSATYGTNASDLTQWIFTADNPANTTYGPVNLRVAPPVGPLEYPPDPPAGSQALWLSGTGSVSTVVNFTQTGVFALRFQAAAKVNKETGVKMFFDNQNITANGASHEGPSSSHWLPGTGWSRDYRLYENNGSFVFNVTNPGLHTIQIQCTGQPRYGGSVDTNRSIYFDKMEMASADAIFAGGIPDAGQALGQVSSGPYTAQLNSQARYAQAYGLRVTAYEGGWSLGGDFGAVALQNWAKYRDPRARQAQHTSADIFARSCGALYTFGTYTTWPTSDTPGAEWYPLTQGVDDFVSCLPPEPLNGHYVPKVLTPSSSKWSRRASTTTGALTEVGGWIGWNVLCSESATWQVLVETTGSGSAKLVLDGTPVGQVSPAGIPFTNSLYLTHGLHNLRVQSASGNVTVLRVMVGQANAPEAPMLISAADGDGAVTLTWSAPTNGPAPLGYRIRYGSASGVYDSMVDVLNMSSLTITGLANNMTYFFSVYARNSNGLSLPSNEKAAAPIAPGQEGVLAAWEFSGYAGNETGAAPTSASSRAGVTALARGTGLTPYATANGFASRISGTTSSSLSQAQGRGQYYEFTITPASGLKLSLSQLLFKPFWQSSTGGAGVAWSLDGLAFNLIPGSGTIASSGSPWTMDLSSEPALQNCPNPIILRVILYGASSSQTSGVGSASGNDIELRGRFDTYNGAAAPSLTPAAGLFTNAVTISLATTTPGALIRYSTDGSVPTAASGQIYNGPFPLTNTATVRAVAVKDGLDVSFLTVSTYVRATFPQTLLPAGCVWKYYDLGQEPTGNWRLPDYNDSLWNLGPAQFGYGDGDEATIVNYGPDANNKYVTTYFRTVFAVSGASNLATLTLNLLRDDGAVVYLNGAQLYRDTNMPSGPVGYNTLASLSLQVPDESTFITIPLPPAILSEGINTLAVEVHQAATNSADGSFDLALAAQSYSPESTASVATNLTVIPTGARWRYNDRGLDLGSNWWTALAYNDAGWSNGAAMLGFGDANGVFPTTVLTNNRQITFYFRHIFVVPELAISGLAIRLQRDDGAIVYLNGTEVFRNNMTNGPVNYLTRALTSIGGSAETNFYPTNISPSLLLPGTNVIAVEVHQQAPDSSDVAFDLELRAFAFARPAGPPPELQAACQSGLLILRWPMSAGAWNVETSSALRAGGGWAPAGQAPSISNGWYWLSVPASYNRSFFRLSRPE